jgi:hypothetical protein
MPANSPRGFMRREIAFGLVNGIGVLIHHDAMSALFFTVAFIFDERPGGMVNRAFSRA